MAQPQSGNNTVSPGSQDGPWGKLADLGGLTPETFEPLVGDVFQVTHLRWENPRTHVNPLYVAPLDEGGQPLPEAYQQVDLELVEVTRFPRLQAAEGGFADRPREPFALLFKGQAEPALMNASLVIHHEQLGAGRFLFNQVQVSLKAPNDGQSHRLYEVIFG